MSDRLPRLRRKKKFPVLLIFLLGVAFSLAAAGTRPKVVIHFFWAPGCEHCAEARPIMEKIAAEFPGDVAMKDYDIWDDRENFQRLISIARRVGQPVSTPSIVVGERVWVGYNPGTAGEVEETVRHCLEVPCGDLSLVSGEEALPVSPPPEAPPAAVNLPWVGEVDTGSLSLPVLAVVLGLLDSVNPCAFFVLLFLLSLLVHARSRGLMFLVGGVFVFFSGLVYFLFMAAWLNLFLVVGHLPLISVGAGVLALIIAGLNIKDFFHFGAGPSLSIPDWAKPRLFARMRGLLQQARILPLMAGTAGLALMANSYELLCTAGFPMVFTRTLTFRGLDPSTYYGYLVLYNGVYILPLLAIVLVFVRTLGSRKLTEEEGRVLKLLSGVMMFLLGLTLLVRPTLLNNPFAALALLLGALVLTFLTVVVWKRTTAKRAR